MGRRLGAVLALTAVLLIACVGVVTAAPPSGPRLAVVSLRDPEWSQLFTVDPKGGARESLYSLSLAKAPIAVYPWSVPTWSPDGTRIVFTALDELYPDLDHTGTSLASISVTGGPVTPIPDTADGYDPVFSPDGHTIAFARQRRSEEPVGGSGHRPPPAVSIWLADLQTGRSTPLTLWRDGVQFFPASFSPDGSRLAVSRSVGGKPSDAVEIGLDGKPIRVLARRAIEPIYSPDGQSIAFLRGAVKVVRRHFPPGGSLRIEAPLTNIYVMNASGGGLRQVTHGRRAEESAPRWDPSGQRLAYTDWRPFDYGKESGSVQEMVGYEFTKSVREINVDGTCPTTVLSGMDSIYYGAVWQPGARGAGPIKC